MLHRLLIVFLASGAASAFLTRAVRDVARAKGWLDSPDSRRHLHGTPVPRLGGVALFLTVVGVAGLGVVARRGLGLTSLLSLRTTFAILGPATIVFLVGLYDDFRALGPYAKFGAQTFAACLLYLDGIGIHRFTFLARGNELTAALGLPLTILWVLLITNAFNLIDGLDGLAAGAALFSVVVLLVESMLGGNPFTAFLGVALAGAIVGFLRFNFHPATIFLGDSGSLFVGFLLSALALAESQKASTMVAVAIPVVCLGLPILDVAIAVVRRFLNGRPLFEADGEHIHHKLLKRGFRQRDAVLILYAVSAAFGLLSLGLLHGGATSALVLIALGIGLSAGLPQLRYLEFKEMIRVLRRTTAQKRIIATNLHVRRAAEALASCQDLSEICRILAESLRASGFDGFGLRLPASRRSALPLPDRARPGFTRGLSRSWTPWEPLAAEWELKLELVDRDGARCGSLSVYKRRTARPLLVDINLLGDGFRTALAGAVRRVTRDRQAASAQAGPAMVSERPKAASA